MNYLRVVKFRDRNRTVVTRGCRERGRRKYRLVGTVSVQDAENILQMDSSDSCTTTWMFLIYHCCCCCCVTPVVSDSVQPHRRQPTRLPRPWASPGKNTGVGCHHLLQCMKVKSESEVTQLCPTLCDPMNARPPCPSPTPGVHSNLCPSRRWCHPSISPSVIPFSSCPQSFPASGSFQASQLATIRWPKDWIFSFNISPSNEHPGLISFRMDWLDLLAVQGTL